jgi:hypothetical protein
MFNPVDLSQTITSANISPGSLMVTAWPLFG